MIDPILHELQRDSRTSPTDLARLLNLTEDQVREQIATWEKDGTILGYQAVIDPERAGKTDVAALIEVRLTPERDGGFDRIARRIAGFAEVKSCYLMSGGYDLAVIVEGPTLQEVARFVSEKLATIGGVISTATHFKLKIYKDKGCETRMDRSTDKLPVTP